MAVTLAQIVTELDAMQILLTKLAADINSLTPPVPTSSESVNGATLNSTAGQLIDANNNIWSLATGAGLEVMQNGTAAGFSANVTMLIYWGHVIYQTNGSGWWSWINSAWTTASDPRVAPPGPPPTPAAAGTIQINLGTPSPASAGVTHISPYMFGAGTEGLGSPGVNDYHAAANSGWQNTYKQQNWRLFRFNTEGTASDWINNSTARTNFTNGFKTFWQNETPASPYVGNRFVFTVGSSDNFPYGPNECLTIANYFRSIGMECFWWEIWNEPDSAVANGSWSPNFTACRNALKNLNPLYQVGGPTVTYPSTGYFNTAKAAGADFCSFHWYPTGNAGQLSGNALFTTGLSSGGAHVQMIQQSNFGPNAPIFLGEWSIGWEAGGDPADQTIDGALFVNNYLYGAMAQPNSKVEMSAIWTIGENTGFTFVNDDGSNVRPRGQVLGKLGRTMGGPRVATSVGSGLSNVLCMASLSGANWAVWLTNYDTNNSHTVNVQGLTGSTYNYWECSAANPMPTSSVNPSSTLAALTLPSRSVVVLSNF